MEHRAVKFFHKKLHHRYLAGPKIRLFDILFLHQTVSCSKLMINSPGAYLETIKKHITGAFFRKYLMVFSR